MVKNLPTVKQNIATKVVLIVPALLSFLSGWGASAIAQQVNAEPAPEPIVRTSLSYPEQAAVDGITGYVDIIFNVDSRNGRVVNPRIVDSDANRIFDDAAMNAFKKWKYHPKYSGQPYLVRLEFALD